METKHVQHLFHRAGFGILPSKLLSLSKMSRKNVVTGLFPKTKKFQKLQLELSGMEAMVKDATKGRLSKPQRKELQRLSREKLKEYNAAWIHRLVHTQEPFREKMTLFWANIFVCRDNHIFHAQQFNNILREHALGHLGDFLKAVAKAPSMSKYLNNRQNIKEKPNENFARELLELFTLGEGNYSEQDIKEAARAFTGWSFRPNGDFYLRQKKHDYGSKSFLGERGNFDGDDIVNIILKQPQCARYICKKVYRYFVHPEINEDHLKEMEGVFYGSYDIAKLMQHVFMSDWFYEKEQHGSKIKSPIELLVGIQKIVPIHFMKKKQQLYLQRIMGQVLLYPPNVAGWKQNRNWIDGNTLLFRMKLPSVLLNDAVIQVSEKGEFEDSFEAYYANTRKRGKKLNIERDWSIFSQEYVSLDRQSLRSYLIQAEIDKDTLFFLDTLTQLENKEYIVQLMSIPEYQLC